ncbi:MAG: Holliday junction resolvase RuvX [Ktedonobacteraceae bacterium]|nr:Holliday junction resolvase RuvX [Ktedonobacteraceae bacterium]
MTRFLALDLGEARIGVALSDATGFLASPYVTLHVSRAEEQTLTAIRRLIDETEAETLIVGLPVSLDGEIHMQGQRIQSYAERLRSSINIPLVFWDERYSTVEAQRLFAQSGADGFSKHEKRNGRRGQGKRKRKGHEIDALAATVILQDFLDSQERKTEDKQV